MRMGANDRVTEEKDVVGLYSQTHSFYQQPIALQFANSTSAISVSSMSSTTKTPLPPPQAPAAAALHQQQYQIAAVEPPSSAAALITYQQQQQQKPQIYTQHEHQQQQHQQQQKLRTEQITSATDVSINVNVNVNANANANANASTVAAAAAHRRQQQKLRRMRELHSLALEGGDTARGYCSCDEQWTSSSPPTSVSPTLSSNEGHDKTSDGSESNETTVPTPTQTPTTATSKATSGETTAEMAAAGGRRVTGSAYKQISVTTGRGRLAVGGNDGGHSRTRPQQKHNNNHHNNSNVDGMGSIWTNIRANEVAKAAAAVVAAKAIGVKAGESRPIPAARLKQQHHVRFSDEKNFSD